MSWSVLLVGVPTLEQGLAVWSARCNQVPNSSGKKAVIHDPGLRAPSVAKFGQYFQGGPSIRPAGSGIAAWAAHGLTTTPSGGIYKVDGERRREARVYCRIIVEVWPTKSLGTVRATAAVGKNSVPWSHSTSETRSREDL